MTATASERTLFFHKFENIAGKILFIAEVKTKSPSGWKSPKSWEYLFDRAVTYGNLVAIHTDPTWGGSFHLLKKARRLIEQRPVAIQPAILAKGIHASDKELRCAFNAGADFALVVGRWPEVAPRERYRYLIEPVSLDQLQHIPKGFKVVWNSRDLSTALESKSVPHDLKKKETFKEARGLWQQWLCQASNIKSVADVHPKANAILVGTHLEEFIASVLSSSPTR